VSAALPPYSNPAGPAMPSHWDRAGMEPLALKEKMACLRLKHGGGELRRIMPNHAGLGRP